MKAYYCSKTQQANECFINNCFHSNLSFFWSVHLFEVASREHRERSWVSGDAVHWVFS